MIKKTLLIALAVVFMTAPAFAHNTPEFDSVGCDNLSIFLDVGDVIVLGDISPISGGMARNMASLFGDMSEMDLIWDDIDYDTHSEFFFSNTGSLRPDVCFPGYESKLSITNTMGHFYMWRVVLQLTPESDLDVCIRDCVTKPQGLDILTEADQTGRYRTPEDILVFLESANPMLTVWAEPGPWANALWQKDKTECLCDENDCEPPASINGAKPCYGRILCARTQPGLCKFPLMNCLYTSKALWEESIVIAMPMDGDRDFDGRRGFQLAAGDMIVVRIIIPGNNTRYIRYGEDNVTIRYIGVVGTDEVGEACTQ